MLYVMEISQSRMKIIFSSVLKSITEVIDDAVEFLSQQGYGFEMFSFKLAVAEGLTNAVKHGNAFNPQLYTVFILDISTGSMVMTFEDQGSGFDWRTALGRDIPDAGEVSGRGLPLLRSYGYSIRYNDAGNILCLVKGGKAE